MRTGYPQAVVIILGMHRSGTSCLAGSLEQLGLDLGGHGDRGSEANARGNRENRAIAIFHENVLRFNGGSWNEPPDKVLWAQRHYQRARELILEYGDKPLVGFKDPRTLLHLPHWKQVLDELGVARHFVGIVRHPMATALSLQHRDGFTLEKGFLLWQSYNRLLLECCQQETVSLLSFDEKEAVFLRQLKTCASRLGLPTAGEEAFFVQGLKHFSGEDEALPESVRQLYLALLKHTTC